RVTTDDGTALEADRVIVTTEAHAAGRLLRYVDPALAALLGEIAYASSATISVGYRRGDVPHALDGFGFVVPRSEGRTVLACTFSSVKYPGRAPPGLHLAGGAYRGVGIADCVRSGEAAAERALGGSPPPSDRLDGAELP